eukprot:CAMPEP_0197907560 /NCGR_PEP_ID=MMETSP1439-20131203/65105_1 /TAXON_ID=66791 /ORGANISM="Gonyaulax spinifera, Strain CCMP409" /LENGTH=169 /DNA_ID=CAMNT_0043529001 /DNA_START=56 /DNA_END=565 /DNA_ORIENTATION=+
MALAAAWRDPRFAGAASRRAFQDRHHTGVAHGAMVAAGGGARERSSSAVGPLAPSLRAPWTPPTGALREVPPAYTHDLRFQPDLGPRAPATGLEWRCRRTMDFAPSRGAGGGVHCGSVADMRPAGVSTARRGEVCMIGWHGYKQTVRRLASEGDSLVASCPDLSALVAA